MEERKFKNPFSDYSDSNSPSIDEKFSNFIKVLIQKNVKIILENTNSSFNTQRPDIYVGLSGIAFMFLKLSQSGVNLDIPALQHAKTYSDQANKILASSKSQKLISLLSGNAGVHIVSAAVSKALSLPYEDDVKKLLKGISIYENPEYLEDGADEFLVGRCGYLLGILWLNKQLQKEILDPNELKRLASIIIKSGRDYSSRYKIKIPLMFQYHGREYLGAAHGVSAILLPLLMVPLNANDLKDVKLSIDAILELQDESGNFPSKYKKPESHLVHWCHGAPGVVYLMAKAYKVFGEQKYLESCLKCGDLVWKFGLLRKGAGICHGVAGSGFVHLLLFRLTGDEKHFYRAKKFAEFLVNEEFISEARRPDRPYSLFEGLAGTVCFLLDLLEPEKSEFPFMNVFD